MERYEAHFDELICFINNRIISLQSSLIQRLGEKTPRKFVAQSEPNSKRVYTNSLLVNNHKGNLSFCKNDDHSKLLDCTQFRNVPQKERAEHVY